jgi:argininosuccinate lyase
MSKKPWGGRFSGATAASVEEFTASHQFDRELYRQDIAGSKAHARMLAAQGLLTQEESDLIVGGLARIEAEIDHGHFEFLDELEDIHMHIEKALVEKIGAAGQKLHTGRSRNDQVALDLRLYLRDEIDRLDELCAGLQMALVRQARRYLGVVMPGYTHLQRAQPVLLSHHLLAYYEMFGRDRGRLADCRKRLNLMPLGASALAGTGLPIDREAVARELDFPALTANSMDTVGDRDFAIEFAAAAALAQVHLSRLAEELVLWSTEEFGFVTLADSHCTGSSIMPQKKNPDIPELIRGKSGRMIGNLVSLLTLVKGLPLTYNRDLQEDKEPVFDSVKTLSACLALAAEMLANLEFRSERLARAAAGGGFMTATDLADYLVTKGMPFRQAHSVVGKVVAHCLEQGKTLTELGLDELQQYSRLIGADVFACLTVEGSVASRRSFGGTAPERVAEALALAEEALGLGD